MLSLFDIPSEVPLVSSGQDVLLPSSPLRIPITTTNNINLVTRFLPKYPEGIEKNTIIGVVPNDKNLKVGDLGTAGMIVQVMSTNWPKSSLVLFVIGLTRIRVEEIVQQEPYLVARISVIPHNIDVEDNEELSNLMEEFKKCASRLMDSLHLFHPIMNKMKALDSLGDGWLVDGYGSLAANSFEEKLHILHTLDLKERIKYIIPLLQRYIAGEGKKVMKRGLPMVKLITGRLPHHSNLLDPDEADDLAELHEKLKKAELPAQAHKIAFKELARLKRMGPFSPEHGVIRNYVELISELPWSSFSPETIDIVKAKKDLDEDHYGMDKLKRRVLEYLAVRQLKNKLRGPILCFVGPPGVGKTSIGRSIAKTLGRQFHRISLGGVCNQSDIRGHRRTYVGALPGRIIQALKQVQVNNPLILLDEIDKLGKSVHGDPGAALLEVLDPEQNSHFVDHYLNIPFDLSQVTFIATANRVTTIPPPLLDRMEVIHVSGYTQEEKLHIAERHLLPKQLELHGLDSSAIIFPEESLKLLISGYTREAGVRGLERKLASVCRAVAVRVAESALLPVIIDHQALEEILGGVVYDDTELCWTRGVAGVSVGLATTPHLGGDVMLVECNKLPGGSGELVLTGHLGPLLKESATLALNWLRTSAHKYSLVCDGGEDMLSDMDVHIHLPAGAVEKDGPSAGITIATALVSLFTGIPVASDIALTGEITLRGVVLPVGGIKEKVVAAHRAGLRRIIMPRKNDKDLSEIPTNILSELSIVLVNHMYEVIDAAFDGQLRPSRQTSLVSKL